MHAQDFEKTRPDLSGIGLGIEVTTECNIRCSHCFARSCPGQISSLPVDLVMKIVAEGYRTGYRNLHITGGEPLLWDGLWACLDSAFAVGFERVFINTNGTLLTREIAGRLSDYDGLTLSVSMEGTESLHDRFRGGGFYARVGAAIEGALQAEINLVVFTVLFKSLLPDLARFADNLYRRFPGIEYLTFLQLTGTPDNALSLSGELLSPEDFVRFVRIVSLLNLCGLRTYVMNDPLVNVASRMVKMPWIPYVYPLYRDGSMMIMSNRSICLSHSTRICFGEYEPGRMERLLLSDPYRKAVSPDTKTCPSCDYARICCEGGLVRPSEGLKDVVSEAPYCKQVLDSICS